ncbi:MAG: carboxypeptidase-like regulatory domain-containing protein, partial [Fibrobacterota bacterium]
MKRLFPVLMLLLHIGHASARDITGVVTVGNTSVPVAAAEVRSEDGQYRAFTDRRGEFVLQTGRRDDYFIVSAVGLPRKKVVLDTLSGDTCRVTLRSVSRKDTRDPLLIGKINNSETDSAISYARITFGDNLRMSDESGLFSLFEEAQDLTLKISAKGFRDTAISVDLEKGVLRSAVISLSPTVPRSERVARMSGAITNADGTPLVDAEVKILNTEYSAHTDDLGMYYLTDILPGVYTVVVRAEGYEAEIVNTLRFTRKEEKERDFRLYK